MSRKSDNKVLVSSLKQIRVEKRHHVQLKVEAAKVGKTIQQLLFEILSDRLD